MISLDSYEDDACKSGVFAVNSKVKILLKNIVKNWRGLLGNM